MTLYRTYQLSDVERMRYVLRYGRGLDVRLTHPPAKPCTRQLVDNAHMQVTCTFHHKVEGYNQCNNIPQNAPVNKIQLMCMRDINKVKLGKNMNNGKVMSI